MEFIANSPKFAKALLGFALSLMSAVMMIIVSIIVISTGEATALCVSFSIIAVVSVASTFYFSYQMGKHS